MTRIGGMLVTLPLLVLTACAGGTKAQAQMSVPPPAGFQKVSALVPLPDFIPGLGTLYVNPKTLPAGPFLGYDKQGHLVSTVYMVPLKDMEAHKNFDDLGVAKNMPVDHVDMYYNAGHPGVAEPHYHVILWYIPSAQADALK